MNQGTDIVTVDENEHQHLWEISELKWMGMGDFNSDDHYIYYQAKNFLAEKLRVALGSTRVQNAMVGSSPKKEKMILVPFKGKRPTSQTKSIFQI